MGLAESALILLGIGIVSSRFKAGTGLQELGTGITSLVAAPLVGTGTGLSTFAGGLRDVFETFGDLGRGLGAIFESIPEFGRKGFPPQQPSRPGISDVAPAPVTPPKIWYATQPVLVTDSGGSPQTLLTGGGGNVPKPTIYGPVDITIAPPPRLPTLPGYTPPPTRSPGGSTRMKYNVL